jgi:ribonuclease HI
LDLVRGFVGTLLEDDVLMSGGAPGVDTAAEEAAEKRGLETRILRPDWENEGRAAPFMRNTEMAREGDHIVAFWDGKSKGTLDTIKKAEKFDKELTLCVYEPGQPIQWKTSLWNAPELFAQNYEEVFQKASWLRAASIKIVEEEELWWKTIPHGYMFRFGGGAVLSWWPNRGSCAWGGSAREREPDRSFVECVKNYEPQPEHVEKIPDKPPPGTVLIFTDGACRDNPGPAGWGAVLAYGEHQKEIYGYLGRQTNNIAELTAILMALKAVKRPKLSVRLYTDSAYSIGVLTKGWRAQKNRELIMGIKRQMRRFPDLQIRKVRAHVGHKLNETANDLAIQAIQEEIG